MNRGGYGSETGDKKTRNTFLKILIGCIWCAVIAVCFIYRKHFTAAELASLTPKSTAAAAAVMLLLFALKSVTVVVYCGALYIASGIVFPLPLAIAVNLVGTAIMSSIPFFIGRSAVGDTVKRIAEKHPRVEEIQRLRRGNDLFLSFLVRIIGLLPSDPLSAYMGAMGTDYKEYLAGTMLGLLPSAIAFPIMGSAISNPKSPVFIAAVVFEVCVTVTSAFAYKRIKRKHLKGKNE